MVGKIEVGKIIHSGKLSLENDGRGSCSREKDVAPKKVLFVSVDKLSDALERGIDIGQRIIMIAENIKYVIDELYGPKKGGKVKKRMKKKVKKVKRKKATQARSGSNASGDVTTLQPASLKTPTSLTHPTSGPVKPRTSG